jgi:hypothetical protein
MEGAVSEKLLQIWPRPGPETLIRGHEGWRGARGESTVLLWLFWRREPELASSFGSRLSGVFRAIIQHQRVHRDLSPRPGSHSCPVPTTHCPLPTNKRWSGRSNCPIAACGMLRDVALVSALLPGTMWKSCFYLRTHVSVPFRIRLISVTGAEAEIGGSGGPIEMRSFLLTT